MVLLLNMVLMILKMLSRLLAGGLAQSTDLLFIGDEIIEVYDTTLDQVQIVII